MVSLPLILDGMTEGPYSIGRGGSAPKITFSTSEETFQLAFLQTSTLFFLNAHSLPLDGNPSRSFPS